MPKIISRLSVLVLLLSVLSACGQKGALYLPDTEDQEETATTTTS
ncbi:MAG: putative small lipoprotein YifL [Parasphingorhabdus sp.]|jgi:predicted small lipoprotein YifL